MPDPRSTVSRIALICLMAEYNERMNRQVYETAGQLSSEELTADRNAFFGSILGTLNHIAVGDTIWLKRFALHPANYSTLDPVRKLPTPAALNQMLFPRLEELQRHRTRLDDVIKHWAASVSESDLDVTLSYSNMQGVKTARNFFGLVMHFFNHQTHHRGQATTLLSQAGVDVGITDLVSVIPTEVGNKALGECRNKSS